MYAVHLSMVIDRQDTAAESEAPRETERVRCIPGVCTPGWVPGRVYPQIGPRDVSVMLSLSRSVMLSLFFSYVKNNERCQFWP